VHPKSITGLEVKQQWNNEKVRVLVPAGWMPEPVFGMRDASFRIAGPNGAEADLAISRLPLTGGTLADNINRWRNQVGLPELSEVQTMQSVKELEVSGKKGVLLELDSEENPQLAIKGVILESDTERIFIKLSGPRSLVLREQENWNAFMDSLEINHAP
jgi:hypothetical protein